MSNVLERRLEEAIRAQSVEDVSKEGGCTMLPPDAETMTFMKDHPELGAAMRELCNLLAAQGWVTQVVPRVQWDPETGDRHFCIDIASSLPGKEARSMLHAFLDESVPERIMEFDDELIVSVVERSAA